MIYVYAALIALGMDFVFIAGFVFLVWFVIHHYKAQVAAEITRRMMPTMPPPIPRIRKPNPSDSA